MSNKVENTLFIVPPLFRFTNELSTYMELGRRVVRSIRLAHSLRQSAVVQELARILCNFPMREYQLIGQYYLVWCDCRENNYRTESLEGIIGQTETYKAQGLITRAAFEGYRGNIDLEAYFYLEASKANPTISERVDIQKSLAVVKAKEGYHKSALRDLEQTLPIARYSDPVVYYDVLNSYAVELVKAGRITEAHTASQRVVASPFISAYPEWCETHEEIAQQRTSRASVTFSAATVPETTNLLHMPERSIGAAEPFTAQQRAVIFDLLDWKKKKMTNKDERPPKPVTSEEKQARLKEIEKLGGREMLMQIMNALGDESVENDKLRKALTVLEGLDEG